MCPGVDSASENEYQGFPLGVKAAGAWGWRPTTLVVPNVKKLRGLNVPGTHLGPWGLLWAWPLPLPLPISSMTTQAIYIEARSCNHCCRVEAINVPYYGSAFVGFGTQHAIRTRYNVVGGLSGCTLFFYIISTATRVSENVTRHKMYVLISLQRLSETFLILRRIERDIIISMYWSSCKTPIILVRSCESWIFWTYFRNILKYQI
jgi:hypothetical protein